MDKRMVLEYLIEENNGYLLTSMAVEKNVTKPFLARYVREKGMEKVARGVYITDDVITPAAVEYEYKLMFEDRTISLLSYNTKLCLQRRCRQLLQEVLLIPE